MDSNYNLSDIAAVMGNENCGSNGGMWIFALLILLAIGNGGFFGNNRNNVENMATSADRCFLHTHHRMCSKE